jgi:hypothetical protein
MRSTRTVLAAAAISLFLGTMHAAAAERILSIFEVRQQFTRCGYDLGNPQPTVANPYIVVRDPGAASVRGADLRIVMAMVYPTTAAAVAAHQQAHQQAEARLQQSYSWSDDHGPQLIAGYGASVWRANVALVQSSSRTLASMWSVDGQTDEARVARPELFELGFGASSGPYGVDRDYVACLEDASYAAQPLPLGDVEEHDPTTPVFLPGRPW